MQEQDIMELLGELDEETAVQLAERFPPLSESDRGRLFGRLEDTLDMTADISAEQLQITPAPRFAWMRHAAAAAAFLLVAGGLLVGMLTLDRLTPMQSDQTESTDHIGTVPVHAIGERYAAANLADSGRLWITVDAAGAVADAENLYSVTITLESGGTSGGQPQVIFADNFMSAGGSVNGVWDAVQPCHIVTEGESGGYPYAVSIPAGGSCTIELWYPLADVPEEWMLVTSYNMTQPCVRLQTGGIS